MSKLYRSLLWSGLVAAGVTACGDNVTPPPPPPPVVQVHSVSVAPNPGNIAPGGTLPMSATVNAEAGVATTVTWSSSNAAVVSIGATTGIATAVATATAGTSVAITACSTVVTSVCGQATVNVLPSTAATVTSVVVTPQNIPLTLAAGPSHQVQATSQVTGTNNPPQTVTWTSLSPGIASVSATGLITAVGTGTAVITACSTLAGFTGVCGSTTVNVPSVTPASVQVTSVTWVQPTPITSCIQGAGNSVPVILANVRCQIEVTVQVNSGDQQLKRVDVLIGGKVLASQTFAAAGPGGPALSPISSEITLSMDTRQLRLDPTSHALEPVVFNGNQAITSELFVQDVATPIASNAIPVTMNNMDALVILDHFTPGLAATFTPNNSTATFGGFFNATSVTFTGAQYISFSTVKPATIPFTDALCTEDAPNSTVNGTAQTGITVNTAFDCSGTEGQMGITGFGPITIPAGAVGPDGTTVQLPTQLSNITSGFLVPIEHSPTFPPGETRWNLITPASPTQALLGAFIDNAGPTVTVNTVAFNTLFDQPWINGAHDFVASGDVSATDAGSGLAGSVTANLFTSVCTNTVVVNGADPALTGPTLVSSAAGGRRICGVATDNVGNVTHSGPSNFFGIDFLPPVVRMAGTTAALPSLAPFLPTSVSVTPNTTIFQTAAGFLNQVWGMEANDDRAGFDQALLVAQYPSLETLVRSLASGNTGCPILDANVTPNANGLGVLLSDLFVRNTVLAPLDCNMGVGYYTWTGIVTDRAGNQATPVPAARNFAFDPGTPNITGLGYSSSLYIGGQPATFSISANDDLEVVSAALGLNYSGMPNVGCPVGGCQGILYPEGTLTILDQFGNPLMPWTSGPGALPITNVINGAPITLPYFVARVDESCIFNANPYPSCDTGTNGTGSRPTVGADYDINLNGGGGLTDVTKGPNAVLANVADITGRESLTGISAPFLATQFTAVAQPWTAPANPFTWTGAVIGGTIIQAINTVNTSIILPFFNNGIDLTGGSNAVNLFRMNTVTGSWTYCATFPAPTPQDNGINRTYTYTLPVPVAPNACVALTGPWKAMGLKFGAGLFTGPF